MKRKLLTILLSVMFVCCMPAIAFAAGGEYHVKDGVEFQTCWNAAVKDGGTVILDRNVNIASGDYKLVNSNNITIDLNGHSISGVGDKAEYIFQVTDKAKLTITDSKGSGYIQITKKSAKYKAVIAVEDDDAELILESGTLKGNDDTKTRVVYVEDGKFTMNGGAVSDNVYSGWGSGVYVDEGSFVMTGGEICNNIAKKQGDYIGCGGGVYYDGGSSTVFEMTGGSIHNNEAEGSGGGIYFDDGGKYTTFGSGKAVLSGGEISKNKASYGGGIYMSDNSDGVELEGTLVITDNWSSEKKGGGVYVNRQDPWISDSTAIIGGSVQIYGNGANGATDVFCDPQYDAIEIKSDINTTPDKHAWVGVASSFCNFPMDRDQTYADYKFNEDDNDEKYSVCFFGGEGYGSDTLSEYKKVQKLLVLSDDGDTPEFVLTHNTREMDSANLNYDALVDRNGNRVSGVNYRVESDKTRRVITVDSRAGFFLDNYNEFLYSNSVQCKGITFKKMEKTRDEKEKQTVYTLYYLCEFEKTEGDKTYSKNYYQTLEIRVDDHKVEFDMNGHGTSTIADQTVGDWEKASEPEEPSGDKGDHFRGWYTDPECTEKYDFDEPVTEDIVLYAGWASIGPPPLLCVVDFDMNGHGEQVEKEGIGCGGKAEEPEAPSEDGWTFGGWFADQECNDAWNFDTDIVEEDMCLYALWTQDEEPSEAGPFTVSFIMNGHGNQVPAQIVKKDNTASKPNDPAKDEEWTFVSWYTDKECTAEFNFATLITKDTNLYAKWTADTIKYDVTFKGNFEGSGYSEDVSQTYGEKYELPEMNPTREGYSFAGWYTEPQYGEKITYDTTVSKKSAHELYAQWKKTEQATCIPPEPIEGLEYTGEKQKIAYGGSAKGGTMKYVVLKEGQHIEGNTIPWSDTIEQPDPTEAGTYFVYYYVDGDDYHTDFGPSDTLDDNYRIEVVVAKAEAPYTAPQPKENLIAGSEQDLVTAGSTNVGTMYYTATDSPEAPAKGSDAWKDTVPQADKAGTYYVHYYVKVSEENPNYQSTEPAFVAVKILPSEVTVKYNMNGHGTQISDVTAKAWSTIEPPADPSEENCTFKGWYKEKECINEWNFDEDVVSENPTTLYAGWQVLIEYDVWVNGVQVTSDNADNVLGDDSETVKYNPKSKTLTLNNAYLKKGYEDDEDDISCIYTENSSVTSIVLKGDNRISSETATCGIKSEGNLAISGSGTLDITIDNDTEKGVAALDCRGYLKNSATLNVTAENSQGEVTAVSGAEGLENTGKISATSSDNVQGSVAVVCNVELKNSGEIIAGSGKASNGTSIAVVCDGVITNNGKITATATADSNESYGLLAHADINNSSTIYATGKDGGIAAFGKIKNAPKLCVGGSDEHNQSMDKLKPAHIGKQEGKDANIVMVGEDVALTAYLGPHIDENKDHICDICGTTLPDGGGDSDKDGKSGNGSGTGDDHNILPFAIAMILSLVVATVTLTRRRMQRR